MSIVSAFNKLGQTVMPKVGAAAFPDTMTVVAETLSVDSGGASKKTGTSNAYTSIPCVYEPTTVERRIEQGGKVLVSQEYKVTFPTHTSGGSRINIDPKTHRLAVNARGNAPAKTFRIISIKDHQDVMFEAVCIREN